MQNLIEIKVGSVTLPWWHEWQKSSYQMGSGPDVCDEVGVTCIRIAILCFSYLSGSPSHLINVGNLTASPLGEIL